MADVKRDYVRSRLIHLADPAAARASLQAVFSELMAEGRSSTAAEGELFHRGYETIYGFRDPASSVEVTTLRLRIIGSVPPIVLPRADAAEGEAAPTQRRVFIEDAFRAVPVHRRADLRIGQDIRGPALIEQEDTTVWILPGWRGAMDEVGNIILRAEAPA